MFDRRRTAMVRKYVVDRGITDERVVAAMLKIPRHLFVDQTFVHEAYKDKALPIGYGQTISHPTTVAYMTQLLELTGSERVLEIGTGSGYQAAVLAAMGVKVYSIERIPELAQRARTIFDQIGYYTIGVKIGDGTLGWTAHAPYDRIIITAASPDIPETLLRQLAEQGRMVIPVEEKSRQKLMIITRETGKYHILEDYTRKFVPLIGKEGWTL
jgi:protein-L-isoaspartate(D-aspartate) O-methyltransferase